MPAASSPTYPTGTRPTRCPDLNVARSTLRSGPRAAVSGPRSAWPAASSPTVTRRCGGARAGPGRRRRRRPRCRRLARLTRAAGSSATGSQRLMPSPPDCGPSACATSARRPARRDEAAPAGVLRAGRWTSGDRGRVGEQVEQQSLQQPAGPALPELPALQDRVEQCALVRRRAASRRSGPCDLEKLRTCTVRSGSHGPSELTGGGRDRAGRVVLDDDVAGAVARTAASSAARAGVNDTPVGFCARGCRNTAAGRWARPRRGAPGTGPAASRSTPSVSTPRASSRSSSGGKHGFSTIARSPKRSRSGGDRSSGVHRAVDDGEPFRVGNGQRSRSTSASSGSTGSSR